MDVRKIFNFSTAFTLAEVLITLGIIGVVAALTIPTIIQNSQKQELKSGLKEAYTILTNAYTRLKTDNGFMENYNAMYTYYAATADPRQFATDLTSYMNVVKTCSGDFGCVAADGTNSYGRTYTDFQGGSIATASMSYYIGRYQYVLNNGMILFVWQPAGEGAIGVSIDVNGWKGPNVVGKDVFSFIPFSTSPNTLLPRQTDYNHGTICNTSNANTIRIGCPNAALYDDNYWNLW